MSTPDTGGSQSKTPEKELTEEELQALIKQFTEQVKLRTEKLIAQAAAIRERMKSGQEETSAISRKRTTETGSSELSARANIFGHGSIGKGEAFIPNGTTVFFYVTNGLPLKYSELIRVIQTGDMSTAERKTAEQAVPNLELSQVTHEELEKDMRLVSSMDGDTYSIGRNLPDCGSLCSSPVKCKAHWESSKKCEHDPGCTGVLRVIRAQSIHMYVCRVDTSKKRHEIDATADYNEEQRYHYNLLKNKAQEIASAPNQLLARLAFQVLPEQTRISLISVQTELAELRRPIGDWRAFGEDQILAVEPAYSGLDDDEKKTLRERDGSLLFLHTWQSLSSARADTVEVLRGKLHDAETAITQYLSIAENPTPEGEQDRTPDDDADEVTPKVAAAAADDDDAEYEIEYDYGGGKETPDITFDDDDVAHDDPDAAPADNNIREVGKALAVSIGGLCDRIKSSIPLSLDEVKGYENGLDNVSRLLDSEKLNPAVKAVRESFDAAAKSSWWPK